MTDRPPEKNLERDDAARLADQADAIAADYVAPDPDLTQLPPDPDSGPVVSHEDAEKGYRMLGFAVVNQSCTLFVPAWSVTLEERTNVADAMVQALLLWFPDGIIPPKYLSLLVLASAVGSIAMARMDPVTGELPPRHIVVRPAPAAPAAAAPTHIQPAAAH